MRERHQPHKNVSQTQRVKRNNRMDRRFGTVAAGTAKFRTVAAATAKFRTVAAATAKFRRKGASAEEEDSHAGEWCRASSAFGGSVVSDSLTPDLTEAAQRGPLAKCKPSISF